MNNHDPDGLDVAADLMRRLRDSGSSGVPGVAPKKKKKFRPRKKGDPTTVSDALSAVVQEQGWATRLSVPVILGRWAEIVGPVIAEKSTVTGFTAGVVQVSAESTAWAVQLRQLAPQIVAKINAELGDGVIKAINVSGPDAPSWHHGRRTISDGRGPRDTYG